MATLTKMKTLELAQIRDLLGAELLCGDDLGVQVAAVGAADLMSDVLAMSTPGMLLLTGLASAQVIRTAIVADLCAVIFVRGKMPGDTILSLAREANIPVLRTPLTMFEAAGMVYAALTGR
jgi:predicted transcriptional regulator